VLFLFQNKLVYKNALGTWLHQNPLATLLEELTALLRCPNRISGTDKEWKGGDRKRGVKGKEWRWMYRRTPIAKSCVR